MPGMTQEMEDIHRQARDLEEYRKRSLHGEEIPDDNLYIDPHHGTNSIFYRKQDNHKNIRKYTSKTLKSGKVNRRLVY
jgi:hypothetical protein